MPAVQTQKGVSRVPAMMDTEEVGQTVTVRGQDTSNGLLQLHVNIITPDIDECAEGRDNCHGESNSTCTDTDGSFICTCVEGFDGNGTFCEGTQTATVLHVYGMFKSPHLDIDECLNETICDTNAMCMNTYGSFMCSCNVGYTGDGFACVGMQEATGCLVSSEYSWFQMWMNVGVILITIVML